VPFAKGNNENHRTLDSAVHFGPGEEAPHLTSGTSEPACHMREEHTQDGAKTQDSSWNQWEEDKEVQQNSRTLDLE